MMETPPSHLADEDKRKSCLSTRSDKSGATLVTVSSRPSLRSNRSKISKDMKANLAQIIADETVDREDLLSDDEVPRDTSKPPPKLKTSPTLKDLTELFTGRDGSDNAVFDTERSPTRDIDVILRNHHDDEHTASRCVFDPNALFCKVWHIQTSFVVIYIIIFVLTDIGFSWYKISKGLYIFNYIVDAYCWVDMLISFNTGFVHGGHLIMSRKAIWKHYLEFWFWIDLAANVPWESLSVVEKENRKAVKFVKWLKLPRLLRLGRLRKIMRGNARYLDLVSTIGSMLLCIHMGACFWVFIVDPCSAYFDEGPFHDWSYAHEVDDDLVSRNPHLGWECIQDNLVAIYCQAAHVSAAALLGVDRALFGGYISGGGDSSSLLEEVNDYAKKLVVTEDSSGLDAAGVRIRALKLVLLRGRYPLSLSDTLTTNSIISQGGCSSWYGGSQTQSGMNTFAFSYAAALDIFGTVMLLLGLYLQGMLFATLAKLSVTAGASERDFRQDHDEVNRELDQLGRYIPESTQQRIAKHFEFRWVNQAYGPLQMLNPDLLSHSLRSELALYLYKEPVSKVEFLKSAPPAILTRICLNLKLQHYVMHDIIFRRGEAPTGFYMIQMGKVLIKSRQYSYASDDGVELGSGDHFGVAALLASIAERPAFGVNNRGGSTFFSMQGTDFRVVNRKTAFALTVCHLLWLSLESFKQIVNDHQKFFSDLTHSHWVEDDGAKASFAVRHSAEPELLVEMEQEDSITGECRVERNTMVASGSERGSYTALDIVDKGHDKLADGHRQSKLRNGEPSRASSESLQFISSALPGQLRDTVTKDEERPRPSFSAPDSTTVRPFTSGSGQVSGSINSLLPPDGLGSAWMGTRASSSGGLFPLSASLSSGRPSFITRENSNSEMEMRVGKLEQTLHVQGQTIDKAMSLIQELLRAVPDSSI